MVFVLVLADQVKGENLLNSSATQLRFPKIAGKEMKKKMKSIIKITVDISQCNDRRLTSDPTVH